MVQLNYVINRQVKIGNYELDLRVKKWAIHNIMGIQNGVAGQPGKYVIFLDYDEMPYEEIAKDLEALAVKFNLADFYVLKTRKGFHAYNLKVVELGELLQVVFESKADYNHAKAIFTKPNEPYHTLRISPKGREEIIFYDTIYGNAGHVIENKAHATFLKNIMNVPLNELSTYNDTKNIEYVTYYQPVK